MDQTITNGYLKYAFAQNNYFFPQYSPSYSKKRINSNANNDWVDDNLIHYDEINVLNNQNTGLSCGDSYQWTPLSGYQSSCAKFGFLLSQEWPRYYFSTFYPPPNLQCCLYLYCSSGNKQACFSSYAYGSQGDGQPSYTPQTISNLVLYVDQQYTLDTNNLVSFSSGSAFTLQWANMYQQSNSLTTVTLTKTGNIVQFSFSATQSSTAYYIYLQTSSGYYAYTNQFYVEVIQQYQPSIILNNLYTSTLTSMATPYTVFSPLASNSYSNYCSLSFKLYDPSQSTEYSNYNSPFSFNQATGEFKISQFTGYFNWNFKVQVLCYINSQYTPTAISQSLNVNYQVDCTPQISGYQNQIQIPVHLSMPYSVFIASSNATLVNSNTYCKLTYTLLNEQSQDISGTTSPFTFDQSTGEMIINYFGAGASGSGSFYQKVFIQVNGDYISGTSQVKTAKSQLLIFSYSNVTVVTCNPFQSVKSFSSTFSGYVTTGTAFNVFDVSQFYTDVFSPNYCVLSYAITSSTLSAGTSQLDPSTGIFQVTGFTNYLFQQTVTIKVTSKYQNSIGYISTSSITINYVNCQPSITIGNYIQILQTLTTPYSVFIASLSTISSIQNTANGCSIQSFNLLDSSGTDISSTLTPFSFSSQTGEFQITSFSKGNFYLQVKVQMNAQFQNSQFNIQSGVIIINYTVCMPNDQGIGNIFQQVAYPYQSTYTVFYGSTYFSTPTPCTLSYIVYNHPSGIAVSGQQSTFSFDQSTGLFQIINFGGVFDQKFTIKVTSTNPLSTNSYTTGVINIVYISCLPSISGLKNVSYVLKHLITSYQVFSASTYSSTTNSNYCTLSYSSSNPVCNNNTGYQQFSIDYRTGVFMINEYKDNWLQCTFTLIVSATFKQSQSQSASQIMEVNIGMCTAKLDDSLYVNDNKPYKAYVDPQTLPSSPQYVFLFNAWKEVNGFNKQLCFWSYELYYKNGTKCTRSNSQLNIQKGGVYLILTSSKDFNEFYYFRVTWSSKNNYQSDSLKSQVFQVIVKSGLPSGQQNIEKQYNMRSLNKTVVNNGIESIQQVKFNGGECDISVTQINFVDFNPFIILNNQGNSYIQFTQIKSTSSQCQVKQYEFSSNDQELFQNVNVMGGVSFSMDTMSSMFKFNTPITYQILATAYSDNDNRRIQLAQQDGQIVVIDCSKDEIFLKKVLPKDKNTLKSFFILNNSVPILVVNISTSDSFQIDIKGIFFSNKYPQYCQFSQQIYQIKQGSEDIDLSRTSSFIKLSSNGIFSIMKQQSMIFDKCLIYLQASNNQNVQQVSSSHLIELTIYKQKQFTVKKKEKKVSKQQACSGSITDISSSGDVKIIFNDIMFTDFNKSLINSTNTNIKIIPAQNRQDDEDFDPSTLYFNWKVKSFVKDTMMIKLDFNQPLEISPLIIQDLLFINFLNASELLKCINKQTNLNEDYPIMERKIKKQNVDLNDSDGSGIGQALQMFATAPLWLLIVGLLIVLIGFVEVKYLVIFIRTLQLIMLLPGLQVVLPANFMNYLSIIQKLSSYDVLQFFNMYSLPFLKNIQFNNTIPNPLIDQMQNVGFDNRNAMLGLATFTFLIIIYFVRVVLSLIMKIFMIIFKEKYCTKKLYKIISSEIFFNTILSMSIEGLIEFIIFGYLNTITREYTLNGEILGFLFGSFSLYMAGLILPSVLLFIIVIKKQESYSRTKFKQRWGALFELVKVNQLGSKIYYLVYYFRRVIFISVVFHLKREYISVAVAIACFINIIYTVYIGIAKPFIIKKLNYQEQFNETIVQFTTVFIMLFTDWVPKQAQIYFHGFILNVVILVYSCVNVVIILRQIGYSSLLIATKIYNRLCLYTKKSKNCFKGSNERLKKDDFEQEIEIPNILNVHQVRENNEDEDWNQLNENQKIAKYIFDKLQLEKKRQINAKSEEKHKKRNENLRKSLKNLLNHPKKFINPKMDQINEEVESCRDYIFKNAFKEPLDKNSVFRNNIQNIQNPTIQALNFMGNHIFIKKINQGSLMNLIEQIFIDIKGKKDISAQMENLMHELEIYKQSQPKKDSILIDFRIKKFKLDFEKYLANAL